VPDRLDQFSAGGLDRLQSRKLIECLDRVAGIHDGGACAHVDRHAKRLKNFLAARALLDGSLGVKPDAVVATNGDADGERDQLLGFGVEGIRFRPPARL
jgi:hypothetical protein